VCGRIVGTTRRHGMTGAALRAPRVVRLVARLAGAIARHRHTGAVAVATGDAGASGKVNSVLEGHRSRARLWCDAQRQGERHGTCGREGTVAVARRTGERSFRIVMAPIAILRRTNQGHAMRGTRTVAPTTGQFRVESVLEQPPDLVLWRPGRTRARLLARHRRRGRHAGTREHDEQRAHPPEDAAPGGPYRAASHRLPSTYRDLSEGGGVSIGRRERSFLVNKP
jgi:hypothetical protein